MVNMEENSPFLFSNSHSESLLSQYSIENAYLKRTKKPTEDNKPRTMLTLNVSAK